MQNDKWGDGARSTETSRKTCALIIFTCKWKEPVQREMAMDRETVLSMEVGIGPPEKWEQDSSSTVDKMQEERVDTISARKALSSVR